MLRELPEPENGGFGWGYNGGGIRPCQTTGWRCRSSYRPMSCPWIVTPGSKSANCAPPARHSRTPA